MPVATARNVRRLSGIALDTLSAPMRGSDQHARHKRPHDQQDRNLDRSDKHHFAVALYTFAVGLHTPIRNGVVDRGPAGEHCSAGTES
jgi:hypothetical protein